MEEERVYRVYMHTCLKNNKKYIGITRQEPKKRWKNGNGYCKSLFFHNAIKKYGWDNFKHEIILCNLTKEEAEMFEIEMIKYYKTQDRKFGYNIDSGGGASKKHSEYTKLKMRKTKLGKVFSEEHKKNISKSKIGKCVGRKHSDETRLKMSIARKMRVISKESAKKSGLAHKKPVINIDTGEIFENATIAEFHYQGYKSGNLSKACTGKNKTFAGFRWEYI